MGLLDRFKMRLSFRISTRDQSFSVALDEMRQRRRAAAHRLGLQHELRRIEHEVQREADAAKADDAKDKE